MNYFEKRYQEHRDFGQKVQQLVVANGMKKISYTSAALIILLHRGIPLDDTHSGLYRYQDDDYLVLQTISTTGNSQKNDSFQVIGNSLYQSDLFDRGTYTHTDRMGRHTISAYKPSNKGRKRFREKIKPYLDGVPMMETHRLPCHEGLFTLQVPPMANNE